MAEFVKQNVDQSGIAPRHEGAEDRVREPAERRVGGDAPNKDIVSQGPLLCGVAFGRFALEIAAIDDTSE